MLYCSALARSPKQLDLKDEETMRAGARVAILHHEIGGFLHKIDPERADVFDVAIAIVMPPERPDDQRGFILLNGHCALALEHPGMPA